MPGFFLAVLVSGERPDEDTTRKRREKQCRFQQLLELFMIRALYLTVRDINNDPKSIPSLASGLEKCRLSVSIDGRYFQEGVLDSAL